MSSSKRYPDWAVEETILAADVGAKLDWFGVSSSSPEIFELSSLLKRANFHPQETRLENFRSVDSVVTKLNKLRSAHPRYQREIEKGERRGQPFSRIDNSVVQLFLWDTGMMLEVAYEIRRAIASGAEKIGISDQLLRAAVFDGRLPTEAEEDYFSLADVSQGGVPMIMSLRMERDPAVREIKLAAVIQSRGHLCCEVCNFNFEAIYGDQGAGYIEVHHRIPVYASGLVPITPGDLALLCSNCHRMVHRNNWLAIEELASMINNAGQASSSCCIR